MENNYQQALTDLRKELNNTNIDHLTDEETRQRLQEIKNDLEDSLQKADESDSHETLLEQIEAAITHFEATHPRLTNALNNAINTLSNAGI